MPAKIIDGKKIADRIMHDVRREIVDNDIHAGLTVFLVGDDKPSHLYVKLKEKACKKCGINFNKYVIEADATQESIIQAIQFINNDPETDAILVQLPLPEHINEQAVINAIDPKKDVDGFHPKTMEAFLREDSDFMPGLAEGVIRLIESTKQPLEEKQAVIIANSDIFARPVEKLLQDKGISSSYVQPDDQNLEDQVSNADIVIIAIGRSRYLTADMIKPGAIIIDVGTNKEGKQVIGDVDFERVKEVAGFITPVPGGVGPVTVAMLLENTIKLAKRNQS